MIIEISRYSYPCFVLVENGKEIEPYCSYLKFVAALGSRSGNTCRTYATALKLYTVFLDRNDIHYSQISLLHLSEFIAWLLSDEYVINKKKKRSPKTVNTYVQAILGFYKFLYRNEMFTTDIEKGVYEKVISFSTRNYKGFLAHSEKRLQARRNMLKVKVTHKPIETFTPEEVSTLYDACSNLRDKLIIRILFETGIRRGELLSLHVEDFICDRSKGNYIKLTDRQNYSNGAILKSGERTLAISQSLMDLFDDYIFEILDDFNIISGHVFVKLYGENKGAPMDVSCINKLMNRLQEKTGIKTYCHKFRHTHGTLYYNISKNSKSTQDRMGHKQFQTTVQYYIDSSLETQIEEFKKVSESINALGGLFTK